MKKVSLWIVIASLFGLALQAYAQPPLPKEVQADMLIGRIDVAVAAGNAQEALAGIADYRKLGVTMPPALLFMEGRLAAIAKDYARSKKALSEYLALPKARADRSYATALTLYGQVEKEIATATQAALARDRAQCAAFTLPVAARQPGKIFRECPATPEMIIVPGGSFVMGSPSNEEGRSNDEGPQHQVNVNTFAVGKYEITFEEWDICVASGGCNGYLPPSVTGQRGRNPVVYVSWDDAQSYVTWLSEMTGKRYRLLSEAEWEYSARAGTSTAFYTGKNLTRSQANIDGGIHRPVGSYAANSFGLFDTHGNVAELVQDCYSTSYSKTPTDGSAYQHDMCISRVYRGECSLYPKKFHRLSARGSSPVEVRNSPCLGFRVARDLD